MSSNSSVIKRFDGPIGDETGTTLMKKATEESLDTQIRPSVEATPDSASGSGECTAMPLSHDSTLAIDGGDEDTSMDTILRMYLRRLSCENSQRSGMEGDGMDRALSRDMATGHKSRKLTKVCKTGNHSSTKDRNSGTARVKYSKNSQARPKICSSCMRKKAAQN